MTKKKINHKLLLYRLQTKQDPEAFTELYDHYVKQIYRFVFFKVSDHEAAEDITSEVFLKTWNYINGGNKIESFRGLLYRMARNSVIDLYRSRSKQPEVLTEKNTEHLDDNTDLEKMTADQLEVQRIIDSLQHLKQEYREIVSLKYIEELKISEIAEITGKGKVAVRVTLHRALKKLKELLEDQNNI